MPFLFRAIWNTNIKNKVYLINLFPVFMIGSKIGVLALLVTCIAFSIRYIKNNKCKKLDKDKLQKSSKNRWKLLVYISSVIVLFVIFVMIVSNSHFYKNIKIHTEFLGINEPKDIFTYNFLNRFIFSDRLDFLANTHEAYIDANIFQKNFGIGYIERYSTKYESYKLIEMDIFDIFYRIGIIGATIWVYPLIKNTKLGRKKEFEYVLSNFWVILLALVAGHTLTAPAVGIYIVLIMSKNVKIE